MTFVIKLTRGYETVVDDIDADLAAFRWTAYVSQLGQVYAVRSEYRNPKYVGFRLHRVILERKLGMVLESRQLVDHKNTNSLDNTRGNVRLATHAQNMQNRSLRIGVSGYRGVNPYYGKWKAVVTADNERIDLGVFDTPLEAHYAYCKGAIKHHGEFATFGETSPFTPADFDV